MTKSELRNEIYGKFNSILFSTFNTKSQMRRIIFSMFDYINKNKKN